MFRKVSNRLCIKRCGIIYISGERTRRGNEIKDLQFISVLYHPKQNMLGF